MNLGISPLFQSGARNIQNVKNNFAQSISYKNNLTSDKISFTGKPHWYNKDSKLTSGYNEARQLAQTTDSAQERKNINAWLSYVDKDVVSLPNGPLRDRSVQEVRDYLDTLEEMSTCRDFRGHKYPTGYFMYSKLFFNESYTPFVNDALRLGAKLGKKDLDFDPLEFGAVASMDKYRGYSSVRNPEVDVRFLSKAQNEMQLHPEEYSQEENEVMEKLMKYAKTLLLCKKINKSMYPYIDELEALQAGIIIPPASKNAQGIYKVDNLFYKIVLCNQIDSLRKALEVDSGEYSEDEKKLIAELITKFDDNYSIDSMAQEFELIKKDMKENLSSYSCFDSEAMEECVNYFESI